MRFVQVLRERGLGRTDRSASGIPLPPGRKFTPEEWTAAYEAFGDGSAEDRNAFEAGLFLWERMERVRDALLKMGQYIATFPGSDRVAGLCGFMNAFQKRPGNADHKHQEGMELAIEHALTDRALGEFPGDRYTVAEALQGMIDGAKLPLRYAIAGVRLGVPTPIEPLIDHERALFNEMALGRIYESFESAWQGVQWSGARLHRRGLEYLFDETGDLRSVESRLDVFRRTQRFTRDSDEMAPIVERRTNGAKRVPVPEGISLTACRIADLAPEVRHHVSAVQNQRATTTALEIEPFERVNGEKRYNVWYAYLDIPADVRHVIGKRRFFKSTQTGSDAQARPRITALVAGWRDEIAKARKTLPDPKAGFWETLRRDYVEAHTEEAQLVIEEVAEGAARKVPARCLGARSRRSPAQSRRARCKRPDPQSAVTIQG